MSLCTVDGTAVPLSMATRLCVPCLDHEVGAEERGAKKHDDDDLDDIHESVMHFQHLGRDTWYDSRCYLLYYTVVFH